MTKLRGMWEGIELTSAALGQDEENKRQAQTVLDIDAERVKFLNASVAARAGSAGDPFSSLRGWPYR